MAEIKILILTSNMMKKRVIDTLKKSNVALNTVKIICVHGKTEERLKKSTRDNRPGIILYDGQLYSDFLEGYIDATQRTTSAFDMYTRLYFFEKNPNSKELKYPGVGFISDFKELNNLIKLPA